MAGTLCLGTFKVLLIPELFRLPSPFLGTLEKIYMYFWKPRLKIQWAAIIPTSNNVNRKISFNRRIELHWYLTVHPSENRHESSTFSSTRVFFMSSYLHQIIFPSFVSFLERLFPPGTCYIIRERWKYTEICGQDLHSCSLQQGNHTNDSLPHPLLYHHKSAFPLTLTQGQWSLLKLPEPREPALILLTVCKKIKLLW